MSNPIFVADELVTATKMNELPKGVLGYAQVTASQAGIGTTEVDLTGLTVTVTVQAGRRIRVTGFVGTSHQTAAGSENIKIYKAAAQLNNATFFAAAANYFFLFHMAHVDAPTAGSHTYKLRGITSAGTMTVLASATQPAWILVEDIGAV